MSIKSRAEPALVKKLLRPTKLADVTFLNLNFEMIDYIDSQSNGGYRTCKEEKETVGMIFHYAVQTGIHGDDNSDKGQAKKE